MANNPTKMKDPTEAALSAIQDALNLREPAQDPTRPGDGLPPDQPGSADHIFGRRTPPTPQMDEDLFRDEARLVHPPVDEASSPRRAANDDRHLDPHLDHDGDLLGESRDDVRVDADLAPTEDLARELQHHPLVRTVHPCAPAASKRTNLSTLIPAWSSCLPKETLLSVTEG